MNDSNITIRINSDTKARAQALFSSLGMDMSTAINLFINEALEFQGIPFSIRRYNAETEQAIRESHDGVGLSRSFDSIDALMEELDADDQVS